MNKDYNKKDYNKRDQIIQRFLKYEEKHENAIYCGYAISPDRQDLRIIIDFPQSAIFQNYLWRDQSGFQRRIGS